MNTPDRGPADAVTALLLQITQHAERLAALDEREASHHRGITSRLTELASQLTETSDRADTARAAATRQPSLVRSTDSTSKSPSSPPSSRA